MTLALGLAVGCGGDPSSPEANQTPLAITFSISAISDTIEAVSTTPLIITVAHTDGEVVPDTTIELLNISAKFSMTAGGSQVTSGRTDAQGKLAIFARLDTLPTSSYLRATVRGTTVKDSIPITVTPGRPKTLVVEPRDSTLYVDNSYILRSTQRDRRGNTTTRPVALTIREPGVISAAGMWSRDSHTAAHG